MEMVVHGRDQEQWNNLGLSLSLGIAAAADQPPAPCRARSVAPVSSSSLHPEARCWDSNGMHAADRRTLLRGIDVNRPAAPVSTARRTNCSEEVEEDEDPGASSPNSTLSSLSAGGKRGAPPASGAGAGGSDDEDSSPGGSRKKLRLSKDQAAVLEDTFKDHNTLNPKQKAALARQLKLKARQVEVWFQNRRARTKLKQTEVDCELLKRFCETLTDENRRLHKELHDLRALSLYARMPPPPSTTLAICPSCDHRHAAAAAGVGVAGQSPARPAPIRPLFADRPAQRT